jgi:hypothetical protein
MYLGVHIHKTKSKKQEIQFRILRENKGYFGLQKNLRLGCYQKPLQKTIIRPVLTHGSECWPLSGADEMRLVVSERKTLRRQLRLVKEYRPVQKYSK